MKKKSLMITTLLVMIASFAINANANQTAAAHTQVSKVSDEQAFVAKLDEQNKEAFAQLNADQKKAAIATSSKAGVNPNEAVQKVLKDQVAVCEKPAAADNTK